MWHYIICLTISNSAPAGGDEFDLFWRARKSFDPVQTGRSRESVKNGVSRQPQQSNVIVAAWQSVFWMGNSLRHWNHLRPGAVIVAAYLQITQTHDQHRASEIVEINF